MDIYFVRHGETEGNIAHRHQEEKSVLTSLGREQIEAAALKIKELRPTHFYASLRVRTIESARIIASQIDMTPDTSDLFVELCRPKDIYGLHHRSPKSIWYMLRWFCGCRGGDSCDEKGESYKAFRKRIKAAKEFLEGHPADAKVVVVTHSIFINLFLVHMNRDRSITPWRALTTFFRVLNTKNGSITHIEYNPAKSPTWQEVKG